ncbi:MAG: dephospho-CoA kinase [Candidatus Muproteobacteria bacterium RBG_16_60_9]|jgi:dephospho-CoA kinase|uniref:Dephospho-CoA kinase n=1 Tax=Candidatus Muproteobacteria bacterium RBG_16_60_9 TaxID=1817755 RepID=A0A1F6VDD3_9PROT|nr:MAG: dephospho-CoA kinase [Candidatus Muproteobacteria bacterium RBG_16_60_9]
MPMLRIGLTGGIGSGKSTVAELFTRRGVPVIDTDVIARQIVTPGQPALAEIAREFGSDLLDASGQLDRARMRRRVFDDPTARRRLEAILHPRIRAAVRDQIAALKAPYCLIVIPLLVETGFNEVIDRVLVVDVDEVHQQERTSRRDIVPTNEVQKIMATQATREQRLARADDVIVNNGVVADLEREVDRLHASYLALGRRPRNSN